jgi:hypothetical protein
MKRVMVSLASAALLAALTASPAHAVPGASVQRGTGCGMLDALGRTFFAVHANRQIVSTPSGQRVVRCQGMLEPGLPLPTHAVVLRGFECLFNGSTQEVITPSGTANLVCTSA